MLTPPPVNPGKPQGAAVAPRHSIIDNHILTDQLLATLGHMIEVASLGSGYMTPDLAEWCGTALIRWAEQDRNEMLRHLTRSDAPEEHPRLAMVAPNTTR